jgi:MoaA/NifB/PqqE/SkfB family radical SAM enzyme
MNIDSIKKIELEITSNCNAACPGCARTQNVDLLEINSFGLNDLKRMFPDERYIKGKEFKFCGVLGDPIANKECLEMVEYLALNGGYCQLSTNGGLQSTRWWNRLGALSKNTNLVDVHFCIDGHRETNHIYRVNTVFDVIERNMQSYADAQGQASWIYIVFDHNEYELDAAKDHASRLGFQFATRTGMRNSYHNWVANIRKKNKDTREVEVEQTVITTTGSKEHSRKQDVYKLEQFISTYSSNKLFMIPTKEEVLQTMKCKLVHEAEIFIASNQTLWPCCFLWDSMFKNKENIVEKLSEYSDGWNSLHNQSINDVLSHPWFDKILAESWNPIHEKHFTRCIKTCAYNKAYQNEINYVTK